MDRTTLELPVELGRALDEVAGRTGRSRTELIHEALRDFLGWSEHTEAPPEWPRSIGIIDAPDAPPAAELEDWLRANWRPEDDWGRS